MDLILSTFTVLFIVVDPIGLVPIFAGLTPGVPEPARARMALKAVALSAAILIVFVLLGDALLEWIQVELAAFRIAGGILLFLLAIDMVFARQSGLRSTTASERAEAQVREDLSVFPLAFPLIAGPGALTTVLLVASDHRGEPMFLGIVMGVLAVVLLVTLVALLAAGRIMRVIGETGANVISRVLGLVLAALAVQYVIDGIRAALAWAGGVGGIGGLSS